MSEHTTELLPCPFCGGAAYRHELIEHYPASADGPAGSYSAWFHIGCNVCGIEVGDEYESAAIADWNRRSYATVLCQQGEPAAGGLRDLTERELMQAVRAANLGGDTIRLSYDSGPYEVTKPTHVAGLLAKAVQRKFCEVNGLPAPTSEGKTE